MDFLGSPSMSFLDAEIVEEVTLSLGNDGSGLPLSRNLLHGQARLRHIG